MATKNIVQKLVGKLKKEKVPVLMAGLVTNRDKSPKFLEVIIARPQRYNNPELIKNIPKKFMGIKVKIL